MRKRVELQIQRDQVKVLSMTESFSIVAAQVFGSADDEVEEVEIDSLEAAMRMANEINGLMG